MDEKDEKIKVLEQSVTFLMDRIKLLDQRYMGLMALYNAAEGLRELDNRQVKNAS